MTLIVRPDELDAMIESGGVAASMSANSLILKSGRSGPFSWTRSASDNAFFMSEVKVSLSREAFFASPMAVRSGHAASIYSRRLLSAFGAGSVAITSRPHAKYCAAQLAPITPVPTIAIRRTGLSNAIICVLLCPKALEPAIRTRSAWEWSRGSDAETAALFGSARLALIDVRFAYILEETWSIVLVGCLRSPNDSVGFNGQSRVHKELYR